MTNPIINGTPCWADVTVTDVDGARNFYSKLFGWTFTERREDLGGYFQAQKDGKSVAGFYDMMPGMNVPVWGVYFSVDDVNKTSDLISDNGGTIISPAMDVMGMGHMLVASIQPAPFSACGNQAPSPALRYSIRRAL